MSRERDEAYVDQWANARIIGNTRNHCEDGEMAYRDVRDSPRRDENECEELQRRLRSGIGCGWNRNLR
jgi:hypothetical protein